MKKYSVGFITLKLKSSFKSLRDSKYENKQLWDNINNAMDRLEMNTELGIRIPRKLWPKIYIKKYKIDNLWKYDLPQGWRLLYTIKKDDLLIMSIILEWLPHKEYEKKFKY